MQSNPFREITRTYYSNNNLSPANHSNQNMPQPVYNGILIKNNKYVQDIAHLNENDDSFNNENINYIERVERPMMIKLNPMSSSTRQGFIDINPSNLFNPSKSLDQIQMSPINSLQNSENNKRDCLVKHESILHQQMPSSYQDINYYQEAKKCELHDQDLDGAVFYYKKCLDFNHKRDSALKDLATVYHKQGKTQIAIDLLIKEKENYFGDVKAYENLISTLEKQLVPTGKVYLKFILMYNQSQQKITQEDINQIFPKIQKVKDIHYFKDLSLLTPVESPTSICVLEFNSYSNAKKVIEGSLINAQSKIKCFLVDINGKIKIHIQDNKNYDRELIEYHNQYLTPSTFPEALLLVFKDKEQQEIINSDDKKYSWLQDNNMFDYSKGPESFYLNSRKLENKLQIESLLEQSKNKTNQQQQNIAN